MRTDITIEQAPAIVKTNLESWKAIWRERCSLFERFDEGTYSKHILSLLPDLIEEVEHNEKRFSKNEYAKQFFLTILSRYHVELKGSHSTTNALTCSQRIAGTIQAELRLVLEALNVNHDKTGCYLIADLLPCLRRIDSSLRTNESCRRSVTLLMEHLGKEKEIAYDNPEIIELCDALILLFWRKGTLPKSIQSLAGDILSNLKNIDNKQVYSSYPDSPKKGDLSNEEYSQVLASFFKDVTIEDRFRQIVKAYTVEPEEYEVIFKVDGFEENTTGFSIGHVTVYDPRRQSRIKQGKVEDKLWNIFRRVEIVDKNQFCVAVKVSGVDSSSMKLQARRKAERTLGLIARRKTGLKAFTLSSDYAICDSDGAGVVFGTGELKSGVAHTSNLGKWKLKEYERFGFWVNSESPKQTIKTWLASMDWYRRAIECDQSSEMLLNAWVSIEHLFQEQSKTSLRLPGFLRCRPDGKYPNGAWYPNDRISQVQLILALVRIKHELQDYAGNIANRFLPSSKHFFRLMYHKNFLLTKETLSRFVEEDGDTYTGGGFVAVSDDVISELKAANLVMALQDVEQMRELFFQKKVSSTKLQLEMWRIKDDVYNIYRTRNMLMHRAISDSILIEYYAKRALEYSFSLLTELKWNLLSTENDSEIRPIDEYFQEWILDGNLGLEAVQTGDMARFREWAFS